MWILHCKKCGKKAEYNSQSNYNRALRGSGLCNGCARTGQKRTPEQCSKISEATKTAMGIPEVYEKFMSSYTTENRSKRSKSTKQQMARQSNNSDQWQTFLNKSKINRELWWKQADTITKNYILQKVHDGAKKLWNDGFYRNTVSQKMRGKNNPFYGKHHSQETIEKLRKATTERLIKFWSSNKLMGINTKPELQMQSLLRENGILFQTPFVLENKIYDLYLPKYNTIIEVDGCYWHSKNVPLSSMNDQQVRRWKNDRYKDGLAHKNGYKLLRVWEDEINNFNITKELI